jgi:hypothetical protein
MSINREFNKLADEEVMHSHTDLVKRFISSEPALHVTLARKDQCIVGFHMLEPKLANFLKEIRSLGLLQLGNVVHPGWPSRMEATNR